MGGQGGVVKGSFCAVCINSDEYRSAAVWSDLEGILDDLEESGPPCRISKFGWGVNEEDVMGRCRFDDGQTGGYCSLGLKTRTVFLPACLAL